MFNASQKCGFFEKYEKMGAYHWEECRRNSPQYNPPLEARYQVVMKRIGRAARILDIGCGDGYLMNLVSSICDWAVGTDSDPIGISLARERLKEIRNCTFAQSHCSRLPFKSENFNVVLLADVIEHLEDPMTCLKEAVRVLDREGTLLLTTPKWRPDRMWDKLHLQEFKSEDLRSLLEVFFSRVSLSFFWPIGWSRIYATRFGWRALRLFARYVFNPFLDEGLEERKYGQILAVCECPRTL